MQCEAACVRLPFSGWQGAAAGDATPPLGFALFPCAAHGDPQPRSRSFACGRVASLGCSLLLSPPRGSPIRSTRLSCGGGESRAEHAPRELPSPLRGAGLAHTPAWRRETGRGGQNSAVAAFPGRRCWNRRRRIPSLHWLLLVFLRAHQVDFRAVSGDRMINLFYR